MLRAQHHLFGMVLEDQVFQRLLGDLQFPGIGSSNALFGESGG